MALIDKLTNIANAIRAKTGKTEEMTLDQMPSEIASIETGGGGGTGDVGGLTQHTKIYATSNDKNQFTITNPLGGLAKKVSITCPPNCVTETTKGMIQKYILDTDAGIGAMYYLHATNGNLVCSGALQAATPSNAKFVIEDGEIIMRSYGSTNGMWDVSCEYEIEIWQ